MRIAQVSSSAALGKSSTATSTVDFMQAKDVKRLILLRFHKDATVCRNRLELLSEFNPGMDIVGLYAGEEGDFQNIEKALRQHLGHVYCFSGKSAQWKWKNGDLAVRSWYKDYGYRLSFDMLHVIEWDLVLFSSITQLYSHIPPNGVGLTALTPLDNIYGRWYWTSREPYKSEWSELLELVARRFQYDQKPYASLGPGVCLPREFLEKYVSTDIPDLCHDELRLPLFAQILGFRLYDTGFCEKWFDQNEMRIFNCEGQEVKTSTIRMELARPSGRRVFHPYRMVFTPEKPRLAPVPVLG